MKASYLNLSLLALITASSNVLAKPSISVTEPLQYYFGIGTNSNHARCDDGSPYGSWVDGPMLPWRDQYNNTYFNIPHSENFRIQVPDWHNPYSWSMHHVMDSERSTIEAAYAGRQWLFGFYAEGNNVYGLIHNEFYSTSTAKKCLNNNVPLFNAVSERNWSNSVLWAKSTDGGTSFVTKPHDNSSASHSYRAVLVPEPSSMASTGGNTTLYGFFHPSNIVKEGDYYYAFIDHRSLLSGNRLSAGYSIIRTNNLESSTGWQYWGGDSWETVNHNWYQGNNSYQFPYMFHREDNWDPYRTAPRSAMAAQSVRRHSSGKWIVMGFCADVNSFLCFSYSDSLADPRGFETNGRSAVDLDGPNNNVQNDRNDYNSYSAKYISFFDREANDQNFTSISSNSASLVVTRDHNSYYIQRIVFEGF